MDFFFKILIALCLISFSGLANPIGKDIKNVDLEGMIEDLVKKEKETEGVPAKVLSKELSLVHGYNDTQAEGQEASSNFSLSGGLVNNIQNMGGFQKTILNNKIQYNFYFWILPKNFSRSAWNKP